MKLLCCYCSSPTLFQILKVMMIHVPLSVPWCGKQCGGTYTTASFKVLITHLCRRSLQASLLFELFVPSNHYNETSFLLAFWIRFFTDALVMYYTGLFSVYESCDPASVSHFGQPTHYRNCNFNYHGAAASCISASPNTCCSCGELILQYSCANIRPCSGISPAAGPAFKRGHQFR